MESVTSPVISASEQRVAFTGRLASMTRDEAAAFVRRWGAELSPNVTRRTTLLVVGEEGWPLRGDGRLTRNLQAARKLQRTGNAIQILPESDFLGLVLSAGEDDGVRRTCSLLELTRVLGVRRDAIRGWLRAGLIRPAESRDGIPMFDFGQVSRARSLVALLDGGVSIKTVRRSLQQMWRWMSDVDVTLDCLGRIRRDGRRVILSSEEGDLYEPSGQRLFGFDVTEPLRTIAFVNHAGEDPFEVAVRHEDEGDYSAARDAYQQLLQADGPDAEVCFNLGNVLHAMGERAAACERFRQAVELDASFADAWLNLGNVSAESGRPVDAARAFAKALTIDPNYVAACCGLADALDELGRHEEARANWSAYLRRESNGEWADYARSRLSSPA